MPRRRFRRISAIAVNRHGGDHYTAVLAGVRAERRTSGNSPMRSGALVGTIGETPAGPDERSTDSDQHHLHRVTDTNGRIRPNVCGVDNESQNNGRKITSRTRLSLDMLFLRWSIGEQTLSPYMYALIFFSKYIINYSFHNAILWIPFRY